MVLPSSGTISLNDVNVELGKSGTTTASMNSDELRALAGGAAFLPGGSQIGMNEFYGDAMPYYTFNESRGSGANATSYTFTNVSLGTTDSARIVVVLAFTSGSSQPTNITCNIAAQSATRRDLVLSNNNTASIFTRVNTASTTANISVATGGVTQLRCGIACYSVYRVKNTATDGVVVTATDAGTASSSTLDFSPNRFNVYGNMASIFIGGFQTFDNTGSPSRTLSDRTGSNTVINDGTFRTGTENRLIVPASFKAVASDPSGDWVTCTFDQSRVYESVGAIFY